MAVGAAARRYAQAAFELAVERGGEGAWSSALSRMAGFMAERDVARVLENARVPAEAKRQLVEAGVGDLPPLPLNLARLLVAKSRTGLAGEISEHFQALLEERRGIARARAVTAVPLSAEERDALAGRLRQTLGLQVIIETAVDPDIVGGIVVRVGDRLIDGSTRSRLDELKKSLEGAVA